MFGGQGPGAYGVHKQSPKHDPQESSLKPIVSIRTVSWIACTVNGAVRRNSTMFCWPSRRIGVRFFNGIGGKRVGRGRSGRIISVAACQVDGVITQVLKLRDSNDIRHIERRTRLILLSV